MVLRHEIFGFGGFSGHYEPKQDRIIQINKKKSHVDDLKDMKKPNLIDDYIKPSS